MSYEIKCLSRVFFFLPGRKARTFDLDAIFEQTRRTAIERSQHVLGEFFSKHDILSCLVIISSPVSD